MQYLRKQIDQPLILSAENGLCLNIYVDAAFGCHDDGRSHTGLVVKLGDASVMAKSSKQKIVTKDSTEAELVGLSDKLSDAMMCAEFMEEQGHMECSVPVLMQDNRSTISLVTVGGGKFRNKHLKVRKFLVKEKVDGGEIKVCYCPTNQMIADILTKPLQGELFRMLRSKVVNSN